MSVNSSSAERTVVHVSLLAGLLSQIGMKTEPVSPGSAVKGRRPRAEYLGARSAKFAIWPGSALSRSAPDWIVAAELVETSRLWARTVARIEPEWVEPLAQHLVRRSYSEPHWEKKRGSAVALEKVTLYGIPLVTDRKVGYGRIDPAAARELFIRHALVEGTGRHRTGFFAESPAAARRGRGTGASRPPPRPGGPERRSCSPSTTRGYRPRRSPPSTSTPGGRRPAGRTRTFSPSRPLICSARTPPW